jgi:hypothetical protein
LDLKEIIKKRQGQGNGVTDWCKEMGRGVGQCREGKQDGERKASCPWEIGPKSKGNIDKSF